ncbi:MAG: hypothetical protein ABEH83_12530 [Halobacterium sp.]
MPSRRAYLATVASGLVSAAGCLSGSAPQSTSSTTQPTASLTQTTATTTTTTAGVDVDVERTVVRKAVTYESSLGSGGVLAGDDRQYVVSEVRADRDLSVSSFRFTADDQSWQSGLPDTRGGINLTVAGRGMGPVGRTLSDDGTSYLAFTLPTPLSAAEPVIEYQSEGQEASWPVSAAGTEALAAPAPKFELRSLSVPERVTRGEPLNASLTVANVSETDGRFLAALYWPTTVADDDESQLVERQVSAGETATATVEISTERTDGENQATLAVRGHVTAERSVALENES